MDKKILVTESSMPPFEEYVETIRPLWESKWLTNAGCLHNEFEERLKDYLKVDYVSLHTNGHLALYNAIKALDLEGEVITTPFTFVSTTNAIVQNGLVPVFCDINPDTFVIDANKIEELITDKTCAICAVHVYGNVCDVKKIDEIAKKYNLKVIYDAAHAFGVEIDGVGIGNYGDVSMFSMHATKVFHSIEGGVVACKDSKILTKINYLRNFGLKNSEDIVIDGTNSKMSEFQAAMGLCNLKYLDENILKRKKACETYDSVLKDIEGLKINIGQAKVKANYAYYPLFVDKKVFDMGVDELMDILADNNIFPRKYFYPIISEFSYYKKDHDFRKTPIAKNIADDICTLPLYSELDEETILGICDIIKKTRNRSS